MNNRQLMLIKKKQRGNKNTVYDHFFMSRTLLSLVLVSVKSLNFFSLNDLKRIFLINKRSPLHIFKQRF